MQKMSEIPLFLELPQKTFLFGFSRNFLLSNLGESRITQEDIELRIRCLSS